MNTSTKITLPTNSMTLENSGSTFCPRLCKAYRVHSSTPSTA